MASLGISKEYASIEPIVSKLYNSKLRIAILDALTNGPMRLADLKRAVDANAPNTSSKAKDLEEMGMLIRGNEGYRITPYGAMALEKLKGTLDYHTVYEEFKEFWNERGLLKASRLNF